MTGNKRTKRAMENTISSDIVFLLLCEFNIYSPNLSRSKIEPYLIP